MGEMKHIDVDVDTLICERDFWKSKAQALSECLDDLRPQLQNYKSLSDYYKNGLQEIVQMERYPRESGSHVYDGIYPTGRFAVKILKGEWEK